ncbi:MAG: hypothetical protein M3R46_09880, partial [Actinomycetota bacterium]|nr:hypothetical protein [Actinomycetota bacterium]
ASAPPGQVRVRPDQTRQAAARWIQAKSSSSKGKHRSAVTGKYVSSYYGKRHPKTTVRESK